MKLTVAAILLVCAALLAACTPAPAPAVPLSTTPAPAASVTPAPTETPADTSTATAVPTATASATPTPSATSTSTPKPTAILPATPLPSRGPPTSTPTQTPTSPAASAFKIALSGSDAFVARTRLALSFLNTCAPEQLATVQQYIRAIMQSTRSGMEVATGVFLASDVTAFAPGYSEPAQVFWYAGAIVHDARHRWQSQHGTPTNWNTTLEQRQAIEQDARAVQIAALQLCMAQVPQQARTEAAYMLKYLTDIQSGARPCDYCEVEWQNRTW